MDRPGEKLLACTGFTLEQYRDLCGGRTLQAGQCRFERWRPADQALLLRLRRGQCDRGQAFYERHHPALLIEDRPKFHIHMLRPARGVMNVQYPFRQLAVPGLAHGAMLTGLVARHGVVMGNPVALLTQWRTVVTAELPTIGGIGCEDVVVGVQHDGRQRIVFEVGNQS